MYIINVVYLLAQEKSAFTTRSGLWKWSLAIWTHLGTRHLPKADGTSLARTTLEDASLIFR